MAGAMRRMGIYLGLVEDDDPRGYGRYDSRQSDHADYDRRYGRYSDDHSDGDGYADDGSADDDPRALPGGGGAAGAGAGAAGGAAGAGPGAGAPGPLPVRRDRAARPIGLAP